MLSRVSNAPAAISFIFKPVLPKIVHPPSVLARHLRTKVHSERVLDYLARFGSTGIGATINKKVTVGIRKSGKTEIFLNGLKINLPPVIMVLKFLKREKVRVDISSPLPLAYGFGISGACSLATALAVNKLYNLKLDNMELARIAHAAEIMAKTGLGTVATQIIGGFLIKEKAGLLPVFKKIIIRNKTIYAYLLGAISTSKVLNNKKRLNLISREADKALQNIKKLNDLSLAGIMDISYQYCLNSKLIKDEEISNLITKIRFNGGHATMAILGKVVLADKKIQTDYPVIKLRMT